MSSGAVSQQYASCCLAAKARELAPLVADLAALDSGEADSLPEVKLAGNTAETFGARAGAAEAQAVAVFLAKRDDTELLDLSYNTLDDAGAKALATLLEDNKSLKELNLCGNDIGPEGAGRLCDALATAQGGGAGVLFLDLSCNPLGDTGGAAVARMLESNSTLQLLNLSDTELGMQALVAIANALAGPNSALKSVALDNGRIRSTQDEIAQHFARALACNDTLLHLRLGKLNIGDAGLGTLVDYGLTRNHALTVLDLRCNRLTSTCAPVLKRLLQSCPALEELCLANNRLGDEGAAAIAEGLESNDTLSWLELCCNGINDHGLTELAFALAENQTAIGHLALWGNAFGQTAGRAFAHVLAEIEELHTDFIIYADEDGQTVHVARGELA